MLLVAGYNKYKQLIAETNDPENKPRIYPPQVVTIKSDIKSFSTYAHHSVKIDEDGHAYAIGKDLNFRIGTTNRQVYTEFTQITFDEIHEKFISAHCGIQFTLYITELYRLVLCCELDLKTIPRIFQLDTRPISLFGGCKTCAIIDENGDIYLINPANLYKEINNNDSLKNDFYHLRPSIHLPNPAHMIACGTNNLFTLTKDGHIYSTNYQGNLNKYEEFVIPKRNENSKITRISGTGNGFFAIDSDGFVYGYSQCQKFNQLATSDEKSKEHFILIEALQKYKIEEAFCGIGHSFFITKSGELLSCGSNRFRQLLINGFTEQLSPVPLKVDIGKSNKAKSAIAGNAVTVIFLNSVPQNCPNLVNSLVSTSKKISVKKISKKHFLPKVSPVEANKCSSTPSSPISSHITPMNTSSISPKQAPLIQSPIQKKLPAFSEPSTPIRNPNKLSAFSMKSMVPKHSMIKIDNDNQPKKSQIKNDQSDLLDRLEKSEKENEELKIQNSILFKILRQINKGKNDNEKRFISFEELIELKTIRYLSRKETIDVSLVERKTDKKSEYYVQKTFKTADFKKFQKFMREFEIISSINHPSIVKFYRYSNVTRDVPNPLLLVEYLPFNLIELMSNGSIELNDTIKVSMIIDIAFGLRFLHDVQKVMHRNLKPENILLTKKFHAKIGDFAWANSIDIDLVYSQKEAVSMAFMAPELLNGDDYDEKVDQFSFGKIVYYIVTGGKQPPFNMMEIDRGVTFKRLPSFTDLAADLMEKCCAYSAENRPLFSEIIEMIEKGGFLILPNVDASVLKERMIKLKTLESVNNMFDDQGSKDENI